MRSLLAASVAALAMSLSLAANAETIPEHEVNHPLEKAWSPRVYDINAVMGGEGGLQDVDFFRICGKAGQQALVKATKINAVVGWRPQIAYFDDVLGWMNGNRISTLERDHKLTVPFTQDKCYTVGVLNSINRRFNTLDGSVTGTGTAAGDVYSFTVEGVTPPYRQVMVVVKPNAAKNDRLDPPVNPNSNGKIPVAILGEIDFNVTDIDQSSLKFGAEGSEESLSMCNPVLKDVNKDGRLDLLCHFSTSMTDLQPTDSQGVLTGMTNDGLQIQGEGGLRVTPKPVE